MAVERQQVHAGRRPTLQSSRPRARVRSLAAAHRGVRLRGRQLREAGPIQKRRERKFRTPGAGMIGPAALGVALLLGGLFSSVAAEAQQAAKVARIGYLSTNHDANPHLREAFLQGLRDLGYVESRNVVI